jgi:hypothetical protein
MSLFVHTRADNAVRRPLGGWSRFLAAAALSLGLAACGGGGGGADTPSTQPASGLVVTVVDTYDTAIAGATVQATVGSSVLRGITDTNGIAVLAGAEGEATVTVSHAPFFFPKTVTETITGGVTKPLTVKLERATSAAGGSLSTRTSNRPTITSGQTTTRMKFEIELVIVGIDFNAIEGLNASNFRLLECKPDPNTDRADCVRGTNASFDAAYTPANNGVPVSVAWVEGAAVAQPYAAGLMLDQSASIAGSDPTGARLYSAKAFLDGLGTGDWVLLSAFADQAGARIANDPNAVMLGVPAPGILSVYRPFRNSGTVSNAPSYYSSLDSLAALVGGGTPLYDALDLLRGEVTTNGPTDKAKSVVIFTDGDDTACGAPAQCQTARQTSINAANAAGVRIFTIGLSNNVNFEALGELANQTGGAFLFAENAQQLIPLYGSVGRLLSLSLPTYRISWEVDSDPAAFVAGNALLGKVSVTRPGETPFDVPFIFGITNPIIL